MATNMDKDRNWKEYNDRLVRRGEITLYVEPAVLRQDKELENLNKKKVGRRFQYGNGLIFASFALKCFLRLAYRQTEGLVRNITKGLGLEKIPNFRTIWDRISAMKKDEIKFGITSLKPGEKIEVAIDSTGLKKINDGEYRSMRYGKKKDWIKMHFCVNVKNGEVLTEVITIDKRHDNKEFDNLIRPIENNLSQVDGDGAYDSGKNFEWAKEHGVVCAIPVRITSNRHTSRGARKEAIIDQFGLPRGSKSHSHIYYQNNTEKKRRFAQKEWKRKVGYGKRWSVEGGYSRFKRMFGEAIFSKKWDVIEKEIHAKLYVYNRTIVEMF